jgi:hypothetical protein
LALELDGTTLAKGASGLKVNAGGITNTEVSGSAAIAYSKLNLASSIVNADVSNSAAIVYSKLSLANSIVNADISTTAAIDRAKLVAGTANRILVNNGSGLASEAAALTNGQLLIGNTGGAPTAGTITAGSGISVTNGGGSITIAALSVGSPGDISETLFNGANNQVAPANVSLLAFANGVVRSFEALVSISVDATTDLHEVKTLRGVQLASGWDMSETSNGNDTQVALTITSAGQVQYTSASYAGFTSLTIRFRAISTSV